METIQKVAIAGMLFICFIVGYISIGYFTTEELIIEGNIQTMNYLERDMYFEMDRARLTFENGAKYTVYLDDDVLYDFTNRSIIRLRLTRNYFQRTYKIESMVKYENL